MKQNDHRWLNYSGGIRQIGAELTISAVLLVSQDLCPMSCGTSSFGNIQGARII